MFKGLKIVSVALCFIPIHVWGLTADTTQDMNFGTYIQTSPSASGVLGYNSTVSNLSGLVAGSSSTKTNTTIQLTSDHQENVSVVMQTATVTLSDAIGCNIVAQSFTFSSSTIPLQNNSRNLDIGATIAISGGYCQEGTYSGIATLQLDGDQRVTADFTIKVTIEAPLSIEETTGMSFGTILSPSSASTVTLSPTGNYTTTGDVTFANSTITPGEFVVTGVGNRLVTITLPASATLSNGAQTMTVNNFTSNPTHTFTLPGTGTGKSQTVKVGATLHINQQQQSGNYMGTYPVIVSY